MAEATNPITAASNPRVGEDWVLVPRVLDGRMRKTLHSSVSIRCYLDKREASILNDQAWWEAVLAAAPAPGANSPTELSRLAGLSEAATPGSWYTVDAPWGDGTWLVAGNPDPHAGTMVCDCQDVNESRPEDGPDATDDAAFIAASVNFVREMIRSGKLVASTGSGEEAKGETLATIAAWCEQTFGPVEPARVAKRAAEEMDELLAEPTKVEEAADVVIVLSRYPGLWEAVERKMAVNRARKWRLMGDGTGYHVKEEGPAKQWLRDALTPKSSPSQTPVDPQMTVEEARAVLGGIPDRPGAAEEWMRHYRGIAKLTHQEAREKVRSANHFGGIADRIEAALRTLQAAGEVRHDQ